MAGYVLTYFDTVTLPLYNREIEYGPAPARSAVIQTLAGAFDADGDADSEQQFPYTLSFRALVLESTAAAWRSALDDLRAMVRRRARLGRQAEDDATAQWCTARLISAGMQRGVGNVRQIEVSLSFQVLGPWWGHNHSTWTFDDGEYFDTGLLFDEGGYTETMSGGSPHDIVVNNGGNRRVDNAIITITAGSANITALTISKSGETDIDYGAQIDAGDVLVLNCGAMTVTNDGTPDYDNLDIASGHVIPEWLRLDPGDNTIRVEFTGGSTDSTVTVEFTDGWA